MEKETEGEKTLETSLINVDKPNYAIVK